MTDYGLENPITRSRFKNELKNLRKTIPDLSPILESKEERTMTESEIKAIEDTDTLKGDMKEIASELDEYSHRVQLKRGEKKQGAKLGQPKVSALRRGIQKISMSSQIFGRLSENKKISHRDEFSIETEAKKRRKTDI